MIALLVLVSARFCAHLLPHRAGKTVERQLPEGHDDNEWAVRRDCLVFLRSIGAVAEYVDAVVARLDGEVEHNSDVQAEAVRALGALPAYMLAEHAPASVQRVGAGSMADVVHETLSKLPPTVLAERCGAVLVAKLGSGQLDRSEEGSVRRGATDLLMIAAPAMIEQAQAALVEPPADWGAAPASADEFVRPAALAAAAPLAALLRCWPMQYIYFYGTDADEVAQKRAELFALVAPAACACVDAVAATADSAVLHEVYEEARRSSMATYKPFLDRAVRSDEATPYLAQAARLAALLAPRAAECAQPSADFGAVCARADAMTSKVQTLVAQVAKLTGTIVVPEPQYKSPSCAIEEMALAPGRAPGGALDATPLCDCVRSVLDCHDLGVVGRVLALLEAVDDEHGDVGRAGVECLLGTNLSVHLVRALCRFATPTPCGWADLLVNFVFIDITEPDLEKRHVCELQVRLGSLARARAEHDAAGECDRMTVARDMLALRGDAPTPPPYVRPLTAAHEMAQT